MSFSLSIHGKCLNLRRGRPPMQVTQVTAPDDVCASPCELKPPAQRGGNSPRADVRASGGAGGTTGAPGGGARSRARASRIHAAFAARRRASSLPTTMKWPRPKKGGPETGPPLINQTQPGSPFRRGPQTEGPAARSPAHVFRSKTGVKDPLTEVVDWPTNASTTARQ